MPRRKRQHLAEFSSLPLVIDSSPESSKSLPGTWRARFENEQALLLELGCGKGDFAVQLGALQPSVNIVGIDKKGDRLWHGATNASQAGLTNVRFCRLPIERAQEYFAPGEVDEIWITFPDPFPRKKEAKKRLVSPQFQAIYRQIVRQGGIIHLKTDNDGLYAYALSVLADTACTIHFYTDDVHEAPINATVSLLTTFERKYLARGKKIHYVSWSFT
ncbi:tRNA (guanosine(46)-N7)-methyltransferase TrmB [Candidatus Gracilibacteria bacterium]|nr:tRNA (guanosine(46)-N7)-methyltransferase TrmB [Candidatus Gracilibacteria bacterium]